MAFGNEKTLFSLQREPKTFGKGDWYIALHTSGLKTFGQYTVTGRACATLGELRSQIDVLKAELEAVYAAATAEAP